MNNLVLKSLDNFVNWVILTNFDRKSHMLMPIILCETAKIEIFYNLNQWIFFIILFPFHFYRQGDPYPDLMRAFVPTTNKATISEAFMVDEGRPATITIKGKGKRREKLKEKLSTLVPIVLCKIIDIGVSNFWLKLVGIAQLTNW